MVIRPSSPAAEALHEQSRATAGQPRMISAPDTTRTPQYFLGGVLPLEC